jgi:hypothetical protein
VDAVALGVAIGLVVVAVVVFLVAARVARGRPRLNDALEPGEGLIRLDARRAVVALDDRAHAILGWTAADLAEAGSFDEAVLRGDRSAGPRAVTRADGSTIAVAYRELPLGRRSAAAVVRDRSEEVAVAAAAAAAEARNTELSDRVDTLEFELARDAGRRALPDALWRLELVRQHRVGWARGDVPGADELDDPAPRLEAALGAELELLREDVGTYAELAEWAGDESLDASQTLAVLRVVQELIAAVAKRSDELALRVTTRDDAVVVTVTCAGWSDGHDAAPALDVVEAAVRELAGKVERHDEAGALVVDVVLPRAAR